jgi:hypothetical protein
MTLKVAESRLKDAERDLARLDPADMLALSASAGTIVEIAGNEHRGAEGDAGVPRCPRQAARADRRPDAHRGDKPTESDRSRAAPSRTVLSRNCNRHSRRRGPREMLEIHTRGMPLAASVAIPGLAEATLGRTSHGRTSAGSTT